MDEEQEIAKAKAYIAKMRENAKAFTEALGLPPEDMPTVFEVMYKDGHLPEISEADVAQHVGEFVPPKPDELMKRMKALLAQKMNTPQASYVTGDRNSLIAFLIREFIPRYAHSLFPRFGIVEALYLLVLDLPQKVLKGNDKQLFSAVQDLCSQYDIELAAFRDFLPIISTIGWVITQWSMLQKTTREQFKALIVNEAITRGCLSEISHELASYLATNMQEYTVGSVEQVTQLEWGLTYNNALREQRQIVFARVRSYLDLKESNDKPRDLQQREEITQPGATTNEEELKTIIYRLSEGFFKSFYEMSLAHFYSQWKAENMEDQSVEYLMNWYRFYPPNEYGLHQDSSIYFLRNDVSLISWVVVNQSEIVEKSRTWFRNIIVQEAFERAEEFDMTPNTTRLNQLIYYLQHELRH